MYLFVFYFTTGSFFSCVEEKDKGTGHSQDAIRGLLLTTAY